MVWHRRAGAGVALRLIGAVTLTMGAGAVWWLDGGTAAVAVAGAPSPIAYLIALIAFVSGSGGLSLLCLGAHLFDEIIVSPRWQRRSDWPRAE